MKLLERVRKAAAGKLRNLMGVDNNRGWHTIFSSDIGWQADRKLTKDDIVTSAPVYACTTLIASDIAKICIRLMGLQDGVWIESFSPAFSPVLRKPNHFQTRQQFIECWLLSKLLHGNSYILKQRDGRGVVVALYVLDPNRVTPLVAPNGAVYYQLMTDYLSKLTEDMPAAPASEIIHDRGECLFHPLVGVSPLIAASLSAEQGIRILQNSERFFRNQSLPGGFLTAPGTIDDETAGRLKDEFEKNFGGKNIGRLFVGGDGLEYKPIADSAKNAELVEQLKLSAEQICMAFHVPAYMIGAGPQPSYNNIEALNLQYYVQCLQKHFNAVEDLLDDGLGLTSVGYRTEFDLDDLLRMDMSNRVQVAKELVGGGIEAPNEARARFGRLPVAGGESPMMQQQNYSLAALARRDAKEDPFSSGPGTSNDKPQPEPAANPAQPQEDQTDKALHLLFRKSVEELTNV